jgi:hypothetical protein
MLSVGIVSSVESAFDPHFFDGCQIDLFGQIVGRSWADRGLIA